METNQLKKTLYIVRNIVKYGVFGISFLATLHCLLLYIGYDIVYIHIGLCVFLLILSLYLSKLFGLCWVHRLSVCYIMAVILCIIMRRHNLFGIFDIDIHIARGIMFLIGLILQFLTIWKLRTKNC